MAGLVMYSAAVFIEFGHENSQYLTFIMLQCDDPRAISF